MTAFNMSVRTAVRAALFTAAFGVAGAALAQQTTEGVEEIIVTGFRESLKEALVLKREAVGAVDSIVAEDIADFPDLNLAESIQRVPGVAITRQGGEGRQISVRGLGPQFTRVRINGMEALTTTGGTDATGGVNRGRSFDFNIFASELFNSIRVAKSSSADQEEGSLGATVDLSVARPFDYNGFTFVTGAQLGYNDLQEDVDPRATALISNTWANGKVGALLSVAYSDREFKDNGTSAVRWARGGLNAGNFASYEGTPPPLDVVNAAFRPRIPRYDLYENTQERLGVTASFQLAPTQSTVITLDALYANLDSTRTEQFLEIPTFSNANSLSAMDVRQIEIDPRTNNIVYGLFDDVDVRSEQRYDELETEFTQFTLSATHEFNDALTLTALAGRAKSEFKNPVQTTLLWDIQDADNVYYDFRGSSRIPVINYGTADVTNPEAWTLSEIRLRPQTNDNEFTNVALDLKWNIADGMALKFGVQYKEYEFATTSARRSSEAATADQRNVARSLYSNPLSLSGSGLSVPAGNTSVWVTPNVKAATSLFDLRNYAAYGVSTSFDLGNNFGVTEEDTGAYVQFEFRADLGRVPVRGNIGVRYVETDQDATGWLRSPVVEQLTVNNKYDNTLPSLNVVAELTDDFLVRFSAAKAMARANLGQLNPGVAISIAGNSKSVNAGNPFLEPVEADTYDLSFEWYFAEESLLSLALFYKDIGSFVQTIRATGHFSDNPFGLPDSAAVAECARVGGANFNPNDPTQVANCLVDWGFNLPTNTPGGDLKGIEISYQQPFTFLPGVFRDFGVQLNYTYVDSEVAYLNTSGAVAAKETLAGLSKSSANATLYYDNGKFMARVSAAYRDEYLTTVPGRDNNNVEGTAETLNVDFSSRWSVTDNLDITLEALNLTDEFEDQWVDSTGNRLSYYHHTGRQYFLGARYKF
jgi:iron complex outermembrane receptor protein